MKKILFSAVAAMLLIACGDNKKAEQASAEVAADSVAVESVNPDDRGYIVKLGDIAPDFEAVVAGTGEQVKLSDYRGRIVMLQFTASWCGVCREEMPHIESEIWQKHKDNAHFALLGIDRDEPDSTVVKFAQKTGVTYPIALDPDGEIFCRYADRNAGITRNVILDTEGRIVMMTRLYDVNEFNSMVGLIDSLLLEVETAE